MSLSSRSKILKIRKHHVWLTVILYLLSIVIVGALLLGGSEVVTGYVIEEKSQNEIRRMLLLNSIIQEKGSTDIGYSDFDYMLTDRDGKIISSSGFFDLDLDNPDRLIVESDTLRGISINEDSDIDIEALEDLDNYDTVNFYKAPGEEFLSVEDGSLQFKILKFLRSKRLRDFDTKSDETMSFPFWLSVENDDGSTFYYKAQIILRVHDIGYVLGFFLIVAFVAVIILIIALIMIIRSFRTQKKMTALVFFDDITKNRNWTWFLVKGRQILKRKKNAGSEYAVVNLVFANYRYFVICHSLKAGKEMLRKIYEHINVGLSKNEICAHSTSSNFPLLLKYSNNDELTARLEKLVAELGSIDSDHKFAFLAGVVRLADVRDDAGKPVKRKDIDLDVEYNNASAARMKLEGSEESGIVFFDEKFVEEQKWNDLVSEQSLTALENGEFIVYYQPKYDPRDDSLRGAEALIRWDSPKLGFVSPGRFIPLFEKNGFITNIDHYMVSSVARDQKRWLDSGFDCVPVSVNISRAHFIENDLAEQIRDLVDKEGCPHELIEIELTESAFFDDQKSLLTTIGKIKEYGFHISMDDFGSGYSSLNSLKDMPLDVLKLDAGFFRGTSEDGRDRIVVSEAISLAKKLNMKTVAEGVEEKSVVDFLAAEGCDMIQGYYYAKPMPGNDFEARMTQKYRAGLRGDNMSTPAES